MGWRWVVALGWVATVLGAPALGDVASQQALAEALGAKVQNFQSATDESGNVTKLVFINHPMYDQKVGAKPGLTDEDLATLPAFPELRVIHLERQPVTEAGLAVLRGFPRLEQAGFHYMNAFEKTGGPKVSPDFVLVVDGCRDLKVLEVKHNFQMRSIDVEGLQGFPRLERLVLDTSAADSGGLELVKRCPKVWNLELHRTTWSDDEFRQAVEALPELRVLWLKPVGGDPIDYRSLRHLREHPTLEILSLQQRGWEALPWEGGLEHLATIPNLRRLEIGNDLIEKHAAALDRLREARPSLVIDPKLTRFESYRY